MAWPYRSNYYNRRSAAVAPAYSYNVVVDAAPVEAEIERINAVMSSPMFEALPDAKKDFIKSISQQAARKPLSDAQIKYLASIEKGLVPVDSCWWNAEDSDNIKKRQYAIDYYSAMGYWTTIVPKMKADPAYMPTKDTWDRMWENKYINARYGRFCSGSKYQAGEIVTCKYSYGPAKTGIVQSVIYNYNDGQWTYQVVLFESAQRISVFKEPEVKLVEKKRKKKEV